MNVQKSPGPEKKDGTVNPIRVLVVDDSPQARAAVSYFLETQPDIEVVGTAEDGRQALEQVEILHPDLVLMDIQMPVMSGLETTQRLRQQRTSPRVILITLYESPEMEARCKEIGADAFVPKGCLPLKLPAEIGRLFGKR